MNIKKIPIDQSKTISWRDGTSNELYISPNNSAFSKRNFDYRVSIAEVQKTPSIFTEISGFERCLTVLDGEQHLSFNGEKAQTIRQNQSVFFSGNDRTTCQGLSTNFNLIYRPELSVSIQSGCSSIECIEHTDYIIYSLHAYTVMLENECLHLDKSHFTFVQNVNTTIRLQIESENLKNTFILKIGKN